MSPTLILLWKPNKDSCHICRHTPPSSFFFLINVQKVSPSFQSFLHIHPYHPWIRTSLPPLSDFLTSSNAQKLSSPLELDSLFSLKVSRSLSFSSLSATMALIPARASSIESMKIWVQAWVEFPYLFLLFVFSFSELEGRKTELDSDVKDDVRDDIEFSLFCC